MEFLTWFFTQYLVVGVIIGTIGCVVVFRDR